MKSLDKLIITSYGPHLFSRDKAQNKAKLSEANSSRENPSVPNPSASGEKILLHLREQKAYGLEIVREEGDLTGSVHLARVKHILYNIQGAFLDILDHSGNIISCFYSLTPEESENKKMLREGDELLVQVIKDRIKSKAPIVSRQISLRGMYVVLTFGKKGLFFSSKWVGKSGKEFFRTILREKTQELGENSLSLTLRTSAQWVEPSAVEQEIACLQKEMETLLSQRNFRKAPLLLKRPEAGYMEMLQKLLHQGLDEIVTDDKEVYDNLSSYLQSKDIKGPLLRLYEDSRPALHKLYRFEAVFSEALNSRVWLKSGGYIVIETTEALTSIDVNTGKNIKKAQAEDTVRETNKEAAREIARQLRLRNLSGIILIDFINMKRQEDKKEILSLMKNVVAEDTVKVQVLDFTRLCLLEMTRQRIKRTLKEQI